MKVESHPGVPLLVHLKAVALRCLQFARSNSTHFGFAQETKETLLYICGAFHDIAKATSYFQAYLKDPKGAHSQLKNHALPSAIFVFFAVKQLLAKLPQSEQNRDYFLTSICFLVVKRHHGHLGNFKNEITIGDKRDALLKQYASIDPEVVQDIINACLEGHDISIKWSDFLAWFHSGLFEKEFSSEYLNFELNELNDWNDKQKSSAYYLSLWMFSVLLNADKSDVILGGANLILPLPSLDYLERYRKQNKFDAPTSEIDKRKNEAYFSTIECLEKTFDPEKRLYSITLPTGLGKTLTSLGAALKLKTLAGLEGGRIIVTIPFTSIIDQTFQVYEEVFNYPDSTFLLKHHHLAEPKYKEGEDSVRNEDEGHFLIETWQSAIVVTTFVQLLECLITNNKSKLLKLPSISNSVIILDEVQQVPYPIWQVIRRSFFTISENLNCYFILMSATQPLIFEPEKEIKELVPNKKRYFSFFYRTKIICKLSKTLSLKEFIDDIVEYSETNPENDILIILNTKRITLKCFQELRTSLGAANELRYLTTLITPFERKAIINEIKNRPAEKRYIIVSTQLVEAGVDISVDTVFRALAPFDSIVQATGRGNRYNERKFASEVFLYKIEEQYNLSCRLYDKELMVKTELVLKDVQHIDEKDYLHFTEEYYKQVKSLSDYSDSKLLTSLLEMDFEDTGKFSLINEIESESVFVALNNEAKAAWWEYIQIWKNTSLSQLDRKNRFNPIKAKFYDYVINVPIPYGQKTIGLPYEPTHGFYLCECENDIYGIYNYDPNDLSKNEGYVFDNLSSISL